MEFRQNSIANESDSGMKSVPIILIVCEKFLKGYPQGCYDYSIFVDFARIYITISRLRADLVNPDVLHFSPFIKYTEKNNKK